MKKKIAGAIAVLGLAFVGLLYLLGKAYHIGLAESGYKD